MHQLIYATTDTWYNWQPSAPEYYLDYGDKYVKRFSHELRPKLSDTGQKWLDDALINLQIAIESKLKNDPKIELDNDEFERFTFDSHVSAYENAGLFNLPINDLILISTTPDYLDLVQFNGLKQIYQVGTDYIENAKEKPFTTAAKWVEFGLKICSRLNNKQDD